jgi:uncharacterized protein (DUF342 family)
VGVAALQAEGDILVQGGIAGKDKGSVKCGGKLAARFCDAVKVEARDEIAIVKEAINSQMYTDQRLLILRGALIGGWAHAREGAEVRILGSQAGTKTVISVGRDPRVRGQLLELEQGIKKRREAAEKIAATVQPLLAGQKRLTPAQRELATELMYEGQLLETAVRELEQQKQQLVDRSKPQGEPAITVLSQIYQGVTVVVDKLASAFAEPRKGHVKILKRRIENKTELVLVDQMSGSVSVLPSYHYDP